MNLSKREADTLRAFAAIHGRFWKRTLWGMWLKSEYPGVSATYTNVLQGLRNDPNFGPTGLTNYRLPRDTP